MSSYDYKESTPEEIDFVFEVVEDVGVENIIGFVKVGRDQVLSSYKHNKT